MTTGAILYTILRNAEGTYGNYPADLPAPDGWVATLFPQGGGTEQECSEWVNHVWTDMRPWSLRVDLATQAALQAGPEAAPLDVVALEAKEAGEREERERLATAALLAAREARRQLRPVDLQTS